MGIQDRGDISETDGALARPRAVAVRFGVLAAAWAGVVSAQPASELSTGSGPDHEPAPSRWQVALIVGTDVPLDVFVGGQIETPFRLRASMAFGIMPGSYVDVINKFLVGIGAYNQSDADLIRSSLRNSLVWRTHIGYRPWRRHGFYAMAGYGLVGLGGDTTGSEIITAATGKQLPPTDQGAERTFTCKSTLHMVDAEFGWEWHIRERWLVRAALGSVFTIAASTTITPEYQPVAPRLTQDFAVAGAVYLNNLYTSYVFSPVLTASAGYSF